MLYERDAARAEVASPHTPADDQPPLEDAVDGEPATVTAEPITPAQAWRVLREIAGRADDPDAIFTPPEGLWDQAAARVHPSREDGGNRLSGGGCRVAAAVMWPKDRRGGEAVTRG